MTLIQLIAQIIVILIAQIMVILKVESIKYIDNKESTGFSDWKTRSCSDPSIARALLRTLGSLNAMDSAIRRCLIDLERTNQPGIHENNQQSTLSITYLDICKRCLFG